MSMVSQEYARAAQAQRMQRAVAERQARTAASTRRESRRTARAERRAQTSGLAGRVAVVRM